MQVISTEIYYLVLTAGLTGIIWLSYLISRINEIGAKAALGYPQHGFTSHVNWAQRLMSAHKNAVENLTVFTALVIAIELTQLNSTTTAFAAQVYFYSRIAHVVTYGLGIPVLRTLAFIAGFVCQLVIFLQFL